jgi:DNA polymerase V
MPIQFLAIAAFPIVAGAGGPNSMLREPASESSSTPRTRVAISFGSPASESGVGRLDLNEVLIRHPQAAFLMRIGGSAMREAGIDDGDLALIDRALDAAHGQVVIAVVGDDFLCRRLHRRGHEQRLQASDPAVPDIVATDAAGFEVWGVVTHVVRPVLPA